MRDAHAVSNLIFRHNDPVIVVCHNPDWRVLADLARQGGLLCCTNAREAGFLCQFSQIYWSNFKPNEMARSSWSCEVQEMSQAVEETEYFQLARSEMTGRLNFCDPSTAMRTSAASRAPKASGVASEPSPGA